MDAYELNPTYIEILFVSDLRFPSQSHVLCVSVLTEKRILGTM